MKSDFALRETVVLRERSVTREPADDSLVRLKKLVEAANRLLDVAADVVVQMDPNGRLVVLKRVVTIREVWTPA